MTTVTTNADWAPVDRMDLSASASRASGGAHDDGDSIAGYLRQIAQVPLLTADQERALCRQIEAAQHALAAALLTIPEAADRMAVVAGHSLADQTAAEELFQSPSGEPLSEADVRESVAALQAAIRRSGGC